MAFSDYNADYVNAVCINGVAIIVANDIWYVAKKRNGVSSDNAMIHYKYSIVMVASLFYIDSFYYPEIVSVSISMCVAMIYYNISNDMANV